MLLKDRENIIVNKKKGTIVGAGPANMSGNLPGKKSQLDLRPFGVGVPALSRTVLP